MAFPVGRFAPATGETDTYQITVEDGIAITVPRTTSRDIRPHKASHYAARPGRHMAAEDLPRL